MTVQPTPKSGEIPSFFQVRYEKPRKSKLTIGQRKTAYSQTSSQTTPLSKRDLKPLKLVDIEDLRGRETTDLTASSRVEHSSSLEREKISDSPLSRLKRIRSRRQKAEINCLESKEMYEEFLVSGSYLKIEQFHHDISELKKSIQSYSKKKGSIIRSALPGGRLNKLTEELDAKRADLERIKELQSRAEYHLQCQAELSHCDFMLGANFRTVIPEELYWENGTEKREIQRALVERVNMLREILIAQVPEEEINFSREVGAGQIFVPEDDYQEFNNYVIHLEMHPEVKFNPADRILVIPGDEMNEELQVRIVDQCVHKILSDKREIINIGHPGMTMCDQALISTKTFGKRAFMASFNDGCGWGESARGAAIKANRKALKVMEEEIELLLDVSLTSRDIIRIHDKAMMHAHQAVAKDKKLGSTCPQIMTVAGDIAHITLIGDTKCFVIGADMSVKDPTESIRGGTDATDPGGRIGGYIDEDVGYASFDHGAVHGADLRNYTHCMVKLSPGDTVIMCSDGVGDNLGENEADAIRKILLAKVEASGKMPLTREEIANSINRHVQINSLRIKALSGAGLAMSKEADDVNGKPDHAGMLIYTHP